MLAIGRRARPIGASTKRLTDTEVEVSMSRSEGAPEAAAGSGAARAPDAVVAIAPIDALADTVVNVAEDTVGALAEGAPGTTSFIVVLRTLDVEKYNDCSSDLKIGAEVTVDVERDGSSLSWGEVVEAEHPIYKVRNEAGNVAEYMRNDLHERELVSATDVSISDESVWGYWWQFWSINLSKTIQSLRHHTGTAVSPTTAPS